MKNQGLGGYSDKMCAESATKNTSQSIWPNYLGYFGKSKALEFFQNLRKKINTGCP